MADYTFTLHVVNGDVYFMMTNQPTGCENDWLGVMMIRQDQVHLHKRLSYHHHNADI